MGDIILKLEDAELEAVSDHLIAFSRLMQQDKQIQMQMKREVRDLQIAFSNALRRDMLERGVNEDVPAFVSLDGTIRLNLTLDKDGNIRRLEV